MANIVQPPAINPITDQNQAYLIAQMKAQRAQQMAQMLTEQGAQPVQYDQRGPVSWTQGLAKMLQAYEGGKMSNNAIQQTADARSMGAQLMGQAYGMPAAAGSAAPTSGQSAAPAAQPLPASPDGTAPAPAGAPTASPQATAAALKNWATPGPAAPLNPYGAPPALVMMAAQGDPAAKSQLDAFLKAQELTNEQKNSRDPLIGGSVRGNLATQNMTEIQRLQMARKLLPDGSPQAAQLDDQIAKLNYVAPAEIKQGNVALGRDNQPIFYNPKTADGVVPIFQTQGGVTAPTGARALPGYAAANAGIQGAEQGAKQANTVFTGVQGPDGAPMASYGSALFGGGAGQAPAAQASPARAAPPDLNNMTPEQKAAFMARAREQFDLQPTSPTTSRPGGVIHGADPTVQTARTNQQNALSEKWKPLNDAVTNAQTINSRLDTIKDLATKASTGQFADRMQFVNSLLSMAGSEKATDANTAKVLLDKNANQIVAQLGQGGLATDAARAIIGSAYPNSHMPKEAISEASDNLKAANQMLVAKAGVLQQHYLANNPAAYQQAESAFNAAADPRIFQWKAMSGNPAAQAAYAKKLMAQDPSIVDRIHTLDQMGALK